MYWSPQPSVIAGAVALAALYWLCTRQFRDRFADSSRVPAARQFAFYAGIALALIALATPLDTIGDQYLFTAHMLQHLLLTLFAAPLLLGGTPAWLLRHIIATLRLRDFVRGARHPIPAFFTFNLVFALAHVPAFYELTL